MTRARRTRRLLHLPLGAARPASRTERSSSINGQDGTSRGSTNGALVRGAFTHAGTILAAGRTKIKAAHRAIAAARWKRDTLPRHRSHGSLGESPEFEATVDRPQGHALDSIASLAGPARILPAVPSGSRWRGAKAPAQDGDPRDTPDRCTGSAGWTTHGATGPPCALPRWDSTWRCTQAASSAGCTPRRSIPCRRAPLAPCARSERGASRSCSPGRCHRPAPWSPRTRSIAGR